MNNQRVKVMPYQSNKSGGIDIAITSANATVADYCAAMDEYILQGSFERKKATVNTCEGCNICCQERIPLTSIDVLKLFGRIFPGQAVSTEKLAAFFQRYTYVAVNGGMVDISLVRGLDEICLFLNKETDKCLHYGQRPFVCHTYICANSSGRLARLRKSIVNSGEDELVRIWLETSLQTGYIIHEACDPAVDNADWPESAWTGKQGYEQILLKDIVAPDLWLALYETGESDV